MWPQFFFWLTITGRRLPGVLKLHGIALSGF